MAKPDAAVIEKPAADQSAPHPSEKLFAQDHPELVEKPAKDAKKSAFEANLDKAVNTVVEEPVKEEVKEESQEAQKPAEEEAKPAEEQQAETKAPPEEAKGDKGEAVTADSEAEAKKYAEKNNVTLEQAKGEIDELKVILKKYGAEETAINLEMAKAYKNMQSAYDKQKASDAQNQQARMVSNIMADPAAFVAKAEKEHAPKWVEEYKKMFPAKSEMMTDAAIIEECRQVALNKVTQQIGEYQIRLKSDANTRREELIKQVNETDRPFVAEISRVLRGLPDVQVIDKNFNFEDLTRWARGDKKNIEKVEKEAYERGFKAAKSGEIIGEKFVAKPQGASKPKTQASKPAGQDLSAYEKRRAIEMFSSGYDTDEECYEAFIDVVKKRSKK